MDLQFLISALRRHLRLVGAVALVGLALGVLVSALQPEKFVSQSVLLIQPQQTLTGAVSTSGDPDRFVAGQIQVLRGVALASAVAKDLSGTSSQEILDSTKVSQVEDTDLVQVTVSSDSAQQAFKIANGLSTTYIAELRARATQQQDPLAEAFNSDLETIQTSLTELLARVQEQTRIANTAQLAIAQNGPSAELQQTILAADAVISQLNAERQTKLTEYTQVLADKAQLELTASQKVASEIVQPAILPSQPESSSVVLNALAGMITGLLLGAAFVLVRGALGARVLLPDQMAEILGVPIVGAVDLGPEHLETLLGELPEQVKTVLDQARASRPDVLQVAVISADPAVTSSSLAAALCSRFARHGVAVLLVDGDPVNQTVSRRLETPGAGGIEELLSRAAPEESSTRRRAAARQTKMDNTFSSTAVGNIEVLGRGGASAGRALRRDEISRLLEDSCKRAQIVVVDAGSLFGSASSLEFAKAMDAVVLAISDGGHGKAELQSVAAHLGGTTAKGLAVQLSQTSPDDTSTSLEGSARKAGSSKDGSSKDGSSKDGRSKDGSSKDGGSKS
jgi:capsular polysaccharide biosynthesis protein